MPRRRRRLKNISYLSFYNQLQIKFFLTSKKLTFSRGGLDLASLLADFKAGGFVLLTAFAGCGRLFTDAVRLAAGWGRLAAAGWGRPPAATTGRLAATFNRLAVGLVRLTTPVFSVFLLTDSCLEAAAAGAALPGVLSSSFTP
jgi:hypothetical protein